MTVLILAGLVLGSFGYSVSAYAQMRGWIVSNPVLYSLSRMFNARSGIVGSIAYDRGAVSCSIAFPDPQGSVLVQRPDGNVNQVSVRWALTPCDLKTGVFRILVQPGNYHVSFTGYPLTLPSNAEVGGTNLPLTVNVEPRRLTQVEIGINFGI